MHRDFRDFLIVSKLVREEKATAEIIGDGGGVLDMYQQNKDLYAIFIDIKDFDSVNREAFWIMLEKTVVNPSL